MGVEEIGQNLVSLAFLALAVIVGARWAWRREICHRGEDDPKWMIRCIEGGPAVLIGLGIAVSAGTGIYGVAMGWEKFSVPIGLFVMTFIVALPWHWLRRARTFFGSEEAQEQIKRKLAEAMAESDELREKVEQRLSKSREDKRGRKRGDDENPVVR